MMIKAEQQELTYEQRKKLTTSQRGSRYIPQGTRVDGPRVNRHGDIVLNNRKEKNKRGVQSRMGIIQRAPVEVILKGAKEDGTQIQLKMKTRSMRKIQHTRVPVLATVNTTDDGQ